MTHDPDNPLPEPSFTFRRWLTYAVVGINSGLIGWAIYKMDDARSLMWVALALILSNVVFALLYMGGASASDLARIVKSASLFKRP